MKFIKSIFVDASSLPTATEPIYSKLFPIFKTRVEERSGAEVFPGCGENTVAFVLDGELPDEAFKLSDTDGKIVIKGKNFNSLMFGMGQLLHKSRYSDSGMAITGWRGYSAPDCPFRIFYFAIHFYNWYFNTSAEELARYFEDIMLWGYNGINASFARINLHGWSDPGVETTFALLEKLYKTAKELNMATSFMTGNMDFADFNPKVAADMTGVLGKAGHPICISAEGGYEHLASIVLPIVKRLSVIGLDYIMFFPYDEGGCSCAKCAPWGGNGYYRMAKQLYADIRKIVPDIEPLLCTWHFMKGINDKRDFEWLDRALRADFEKGDRWVKYLILETRNGLHEYIKKNGVPGGLSAIDFSDITMRKLEPWGGFGAMSTPLEVERLWNDVKHLMCGAMPYSEGKFDDINKAFLAGVLWEKSRNMRENFDDYCGYEFTPEVADDLWEASVLMENNQYLTNAEAPKPADMKAAERVLEIVEKADASLPEAVKKSWRWRIFYIRGVLDYERYAGAAADGFSYRGHSLPEKFGCWRRYLLGDRTAQRLLHELISIYQMPEVYNPKTHYLHHTVRPLYTPIIENFNSYWEVNHNDNK